jgi:hypothetical protein
MPGRQVFLRRRHVAAAPSRAHRRPRVRAQTASLPVASSCVLERRCCRAASGARAADGPARRVGLPSATSGPVIAAHRYRRSQRRTQPPSRQFPRHFPWSGSEYLLTRDVPEVGRFCGVDRLQITCPRRSKYPSAFTAKTPKNGLEITAATHAPAASSALTVRARDAHRALPERRHTVQPHDPHIARSQHLAHLSAQLTRRPANSSGTCARSPQPA